MVLTEQQEQKQRFFDDFGYLYLPGVFADDIDWIIEEYERVLRDSGVEYDNGQRRGCGKMLEQSERLCTMIDHPVMVSTMTAILGEDYNYTGSGAELMVGDGMWHPDGTFPLVRYVKLILYLDHLTPESGCLRVVPGSHKQGWVGNLDTQDLWGITPEEVPCVAPVNTPGDVILFNLHTLHISLNGGTRRRMLIMGFSSHATTEEEVKDLKRHVHPPMYSDIMLSTASPERMRHLRQPLELVGQTE